MVPTKLQMNIHLVDRARPVLDSLLERLVATRRLDSDPVVIAAEAAAAVAVDDLLPREVEEIVSAAIRILPPRATPFERGFAAGMALALVAERSPG